MKLVLAALVCVFAAAPVSAFAQSVKIKKAINGANEEFKASMTSLKEKCGTDIKVSADKSFEANEETARTASWCKDSAWAVASLCEDADYKEAISKQVKSIVCKFDKSVKKDQHYGNKHELKGGVLTHSYNNDTANVSDETREFLKGKL